ncbi:lipocalin-like domain-containing protein [Chryseosolibacter indicus]|uniref:Lipocalin-like domain-containing protein n=1 Tax=Chryseosolibacter indicus TaxID=2782351 RepID=A0ABS5VRI1_9BACT|nr:lipocalin-like domain-containing protein [Chryseosolibacter indicus]MBT1704050.1 lipocalin-like domain-containing protein [Chryseosolibacter indicus]
MKEFVRDKIIGTWKLVSWTYKDAAGNIINYFSDNPVGILMYDQNGYMNAQLMKSGRANLQASSLMSGNLQETDGAYRSYAAYFGKYYEVSPGELVHEVEGSLFPNWVGQKETRYAKFEDGYLILSAPPVTIDGHETVFNVRWKRA